MLTMSRVPSGCLTVSQRFWAGMARAVSVNNSMKPESNVLEETKCIIFFGLGVFVFYANVLRILHKNNTINSKTGKIFTMYH